MAQFFYKRIVKGQDGSPDTEVRDSFEMSKVIRTLEWEGGKRLVLLDDIHTRKEQVPILNKKGAETGYKNQDITVQSEIYLEPDDALRFVEMFSK